MDSEILKNHVTNLDSDIYCIYNLPPEVIAVLFAYVSRSPASFKDNLLRLIKQKDIDIKPGECIDFESAKERASKFHEKWVVGYGHGSVAEHAIASVAIENVSIIASKVIEDTRLASYTEKSTRYQVFDKTRYIRPDKIIGSLHQELYINTMDHLFDTYARAVEKLIPFMEEKYPKTDEPMYKAVTKARACDVARYLLPAGTLTNLAMTANARVFEHAITKMMSHPLKELQDIGRDMKTEIKKIIPTLVKYADKNEYLIKTDSEFRKKNRSIKNTENKPCSLVHFDPDALNKLAASIIYRWENASYLDIKERVANMSDEERNNVIFDYTSSMGKHDWPMRELEHINYTFDILVDYGAFRDIQRHRIATQTNPDVTVKYGYDVPDAIKETGLIRDYVNAMEQAKESFNIISKDFPSEAQYLVPLGFKKRVLFTWNLRELFHFIKLRSTREGHISYRKIAWDCYDEIVKVHPIIKNILKVDKSKGPSR